MFRIFEFPSSNGGIPVHVREWTPDGVPPRALLQLSHGMCEHISRYDAFARFMASEGFVVFGNDHLGHGETARTPEEVGHFCDRGGWSRVVDDMLALMQMQRERFPGLPCFLLGHSMGSFLSRTFVIRHPEVHLAGLILIGTGQTPKVASVGGYVMFSAARIAFGRHSRPVRLDRMIFGGYNKAFQPARTPRDWLSRDTANVDEYNADPMCGFVFTAAAYQDLMRGLSEITSKGRIQRMDPTLPVLFLSGGSDPVGECGAGVLRAAAAFEAAGLRHPDVKIYPEGRHEMLNETNRDEVYRAIRDWCVARLEV